MCAISIHSYCLKLQTELWVNEVLKAVGRNNL